MAEKTPRRSDVVLERLNALHPKLIDLSLDRTERILAQLGNPECRLPPAIHVAGTNGKGSTIAFMRAIAEAAGLDVHVYTSPHLVRFHERIVLAGAEIDEDVLFAVLKECEEVNAGAPITYFEITTAAAFLSFSRTPADLLLLETGLGGRFDSTNVIARPAATIIAPVSIDHVQFLGGTLADIAFEKAGILKPSVPCIIAMQPDEAFAVIEQRAAEVGAQVLAASRAWDAVPTKTGMSFWDGGGAFDLPRPGLAGRHQTANAGAAIAALRAWRPETFGSDEISAGVRAVKWPARLQRLRAGPLVDLLPDGAELWVDGGHNPGAGIVLADAVLEWQSARPVTLVCAMQKNKDVAGFLEPLTAAADRLVAIDLPGDAKGHSAAEIAAVAGKAGLMAGTAPSLDAAVWQAAANCGPVLICGSLYLAGEVLTENS